MALQRGKKVPDIVSNNFTRLEAVGNNSNRHFYKCNYCGDLPNSKAARIEHRDNKLAQHLSDLRKCPNVPRDVLNAAHRYMEEKKNPGSEADTSSSPDPDITFLGSSTASAGGESNGGDDAGRVVPKKRKVMRNASMNSYVDPGMTEGQKKKSDLDLFRFFVHANVSFLAANSPFLTKFCHGLRATYDPPSSYVMSHDCLDSEHSRIFLLECDRLHEMKLMTLLIDGWEDLLKRSLYGTVAAQVKKHPVVMGLRDMTGARATSEGLLDVVGEAMKLMGIEDGKQVIACTTDNPTVMQAFRRMLEAKFPWVITLPCFLHGLNTIVGDICTHEVAKKNITRANRVVNFFDNSHYWGGEVKDEARRLKVTRGLKQNCESRWYALILMCVSVENHQQPLSTICLRPDAQKKTNGLSAVASDVIDTVFDRQFWPIVSQVNRICKPIVDAIGNCEHREANLADCMLELLQCARAFSLMRCEEGDDPDLLTHAQNVFDKRFAAMATPIHLLALFLHPLCRKLAVSHASRGYDLKKYYEWALTLAAKWKWSDHKAKQLGEDIKAYYQCRGPFSTSDKDGLEWWKNLSVTSEQHPIKAMAIIILSIIPSSAEVERLFSALNGIQSPKRNNLSVDTFEKLGKIRAHYVHNLIQDGTMPVHRKHAHMHTRPEPGINATLTSDLSRSESWVPPFSSETQAELEEDLVDQAFRELKKQTEGETSSINVPSVIRGEVFDLTGLESIDKGAAPAAFDEEITIMGNNSTQWSVQAHLSQF